MPQARSELRFTSLAEFDVWEEQQGESWELHDGVPVVMSPERVDHTRIKYQVWEELKRALRKAGSTCEVIGDGLTVPGRGLRSFRPDVTVLCGERLGGYETKGTQPVVLAEVLSPSTERTDHGLKLDAYLALPSVQHYLLVGRRTAAWSTMPVMPGEAADGVRRRRPPRPRSAGDRGGGRCLL